MLFKSTLSSLPIYFLSLFIIPTYVANKLKNCKGTFCGVITRLIW